MISIQLTTGRFGPILTPESESAIQATAQGFHRRGASPTSRFTLHGPFAVCDAAILLPHHRTVYADPGVAATVTRILTEEGLALSEIKALSP